MKTSTTVIFWFLSVLLPLGLMIPNSPVTAQQLDKPDLTQSFPVGDGPAHLVFDGTNIWVTNSTMTP